MNLQSFLATESAALIVTGVVLLILIASFLVLFLIPGLLHWIRLRRMQTSIDRFETKDYVAEFKRIFADDSRLAHLWKEYQESLHFQHEERDGQMLIKAVRATVSAPML